VATTVRTVLAVRRVSFTLPPRINHDSCSLAPRPAQRRKIQTRETRPLLCVVLALWPIYSESGCQVSRAAGRGRPIISPDRGYKPRRPVRTSGLPASSIANRMSQQGRLASPRRIHPTKTIRAETRERRFRPGSALKGG
jgi:hypothetical protein